MRVRIKNRGKTRSFLSCGSGSEISGVVSGPAALYADRRSVLSFYADPSIYC